MTHCSATTRSGSRILPTSRLLLCAMLAMPSLLAGTQANAQEQSLEHTATTTATPEIQVSLISLEALRMAPVVTPDGKPLGVVEDILSDSRGQVHRLLVKPEDADKAASIDFSRFLREAVSDPTEARTPGDIRYRLVLDMTPEQLANRADQPLSRRLSRQLERSMGDVESGLDSFRNQAADVFRSLGKQLEGSGE